MIFYHMSYGYPSYSIQEGFYQVIYATSISISCIAIGFSRHILDAALYRPYEMFTTW